MKKMITILLITLLLTISITQSHTTNKESKENVNVTISFLSPTKTVQIQQNLQEEQSKTLTESIHNTQEFIKQLTTLKIIATDDSFIHDINTYLTPAWIHETSCFNTIKRSDTTASSFFCSIDSQGSGRTIPFILSPRPRLIHLWSGFDNPTPAYTQVNKLNSDKGFIAQGTQNGITIGFTGVGITTETADESSYSFHGHAIYTTVTADEIRYLPPNNPPKITNIDPPDEQQNVPLETNKLTFDLLDEDGDTMNYTVTTTPDIGSSIKQNVKDGTYTVPISGLQRSTTYQWSITVSDGKDTISANYTFSTPLDRPLVLDPYPSNGSSVSTTLEHLKFTLHDAQEDLMDYTVETNPYIGSASDTQVSNGEIIIPIMGLTMDTWYHWYVNVTDGKHWTREKYSFYTSEIGLVGYWNFDEGSGNTAHDISIYNNHGDVKGAQWTIGIKDNALSFDGSKDSVRVNDGDALNFDDTNAFSLSVWIKWDGETSPRNQGIIQNMFNDKGYKIILNKDGEISFKVGAGSNEQAIDVKIYPNQWYYITAVWDGTNQYLYLNTDLVNHSTLSNFRISAENYKDLEFGNNFAYSDDKNTFNGIIDEIRIYERVLSLSEIISLYENP